MNGTSMGHPHLRPCHGAKTLRRHQNNREINDVILIDADSENIENVIIIDVPESLQKNHGGSTKLRKENNHSFGNVIYIDDDETHDCSHSTGVNNGKFSAGASSSRVSIPVAKNFSDAAAGKCKFVEGNAAPVRLSKAKRTYSGKASTRNRYGLNSDSESDSSDNDYPDCEIVEDSSGEVQEMWEKAFSRRRKDIQNDDSVMRDHDTASRDINWDHHQNIEKNDETGQHEKSPFSSNTGKFNIGDDGPSHSKSKADIHFEKEDLRDCEPGSSHNRMEKRGKHPASSYSAEREELTMEFDHARPSFENEESPIKEPCPPKSESYSCNHSCKTSRVDSEATISKCQSPPQTEVDPGSSFSRDNHENFEEVATGTIKERDHLESGPPHATCSAKKMEIFLPNEPSFNRTMSPDKQVNHSSTTSCNAGGSVSGKPGQLVTEMTLFESNNHDRLKPQDDDPMSNNEPKDDQLDSQNESRLPSLSNSIANEREKLKETDEYKRAIEEEWASRRQALQIQAEEAQHLRRIMKRRKAESMRLLDMERRQKQRLEEIRITQQKDEENMNLKEVIRADVRSELRKLETTCNNLASLLHSLGICINSWPNPLPQEVQAAYKRAVLAFHPDRASRSDIRQQVEAEEKFKLINRLKEKFSHS